MLKPHSPSLLFPPRRNSSHTSWPHCGLDWYEKYGPWENLLQDCQEEEEEKRLSVEIVRHLIMSGVLFSRGFLLSSELRESPTHQNCHAKCLWYCCLGNYLLSLPKSLHAIYAFTLSTDIYRLCTSTVQMPRRECGTRKGSVLAILDLPPKRKTKN